MKVCFQCKTEKPLDAFKKDGRKPFGVYHLCKDCDNQKQRARYAAKGRPGRKPVRRKRQIEQFSSANRLNINAFLESSFIPVTESGCWLWTRATNHLGYGQTYYEGRAVQAHRLSWEHYRGPVPHGLNVLHKCDVPGCINPDHLFVGTHGENMMDKAIKGRTGCAKIGVKEVLLIRSAYPAVKAPSLAAKYGVSTSNVYRIVKRETWQHV